MAGGPAEGRIEQKQYFNNDQSSLKRMEDTTAQIEKVLWVSSRIFKQKTHSGAWIARMSYLGLPLVNPTKIVQFSEYRAMRGGH